MVIDISVKAVAILAAQSIAFITTSLVIFFLFYYSDSSLPYRRWTPKDFVFAAVIAVNFGLCYGLIQINWTP